MYLGLIVAGLWGAVVLLLVWQAVMTVQFHRLKHCAPRGDGALDPVGIGLMYKGLLNELRDTADEKLTLLEDRIEELEMLLNEYETGFPEKRTKHHRFDRRLEWIRRAG